MYFLDHGVPCRALISPSKFGSLVYLDVSTEKKALVFVLHEWMS